MVGSWALSPVLPTAGAFLFVQGAATLCLSIIMRELNPIHGMIVAGVVVFPVLISVLLRKRLTVAFEKKMKTVSRESRGE